MTVHTTEETAGICQPSWAETDRHHPRHWGAFFGERYV